jgi:hypothetical protein
MDFEANEIPGIMFSALRRKNPALCNGLHGWMLDLPRGLRGTWIVCAPVLRESDLRRARRCLARVAARGSIARVRVAARDGASPELPRAGGASPACGARTGDRRTAALRTVRRCNGSLSDSASAELPCPPRCRRQHSVPPLPIRVAVQSPDLRRRRGGQDPTRMLQLRWKCRSTQSG